MPRYAVEIEWDGRHYSGTALQANSETLSSLFNQACARIEEPNALVRCSSRLDAGVSAWALPAHVDLEKEWDCSTLGKAINANLPEAAAVRRIALIENDWDALRSASVKTYAYQVLHRSWKPVLENRAWHVRRLERADLLQEMASKIHGELDLSGFSCLRGDGSDTDQTMRHYQQARWDCVEVPGGQLWTFHISGEGFLYKQIRGLVGTMVAIAQGSYPIESFQRMFQQGRASERHDGNIAPAQGLCLQQVQYQDEPNWAYIDWNTDRSNEAKA